jgi:hypothetical protein
VDESAGVWALTVSNLSLVLLYRQLTEPLTKKCRPVVAAHLPLILIWSRVRSFWPAELETANPVMSHNWIDAIA